MCRVYGMLHATKILFGYPKFSSVTNVLLDLKLRTFNNNFIYLFILFYFMSYMMPVFRLGLIDDY